MFNVKVGDVKECGLEKRARIKILKRKAHHLWEVEVFDGSRFFCFDMTTKELKESGFD